jgi:hypothetical protein
MRGHALRIHADPDDVACVHGYCVIPGRCEASNPESRGEGNEQAQANLEIPGSRFARPGMTASWVNA